MPFNPAMVFTSSTEVIQFRIWRLSRLSWYDMNLVFLDQYWKQLGIEYWKCMVPFGPLPFATLGIILVDVWIPSLN